MTSSPDGQAFETDIPARLDRLPWSRFHVLVVVALGITWALDGLEVTLAGTISSALKDSPSLHLSDTEIGLAGSIYLAGAVLGGLSFGWLTDLWGRRKLFFITLAVYIAATAATGLAWDFWSFALFRFLTGAGIGGEYTAINSTIQELVPARVRAWNDLMINGSFWIGAILAALGSGPLLDARLLGPDHGWRLCFLLGAAIGLLILVMRLWIPESPRWLVTHGQPEEARAVVDGIEQRIAQRGYRPPDEPLPAMRFVCRDRTPLREIARVLLKVHRRRTLVGLCLMAAQAFFYNAIFFTYALVLIDFYQVPGDRVGHYILPFAIGNVLGPILLGRLFDTVGRRPMISFCYGISGILLIGSGALFVSGALTARTQTLAWMVIFFFASAAASSAYLTVSETFPLEIRAIAIAIFYALGTALGGIAGPALFGRLIATGSRDSVFIGYLIGAGLMILAAVVQAIWGVASERQSLESVARPLTAAE